jgi:hypothetical protein
MSAPWSLTVSLPVAQDDRRIGDAGDDSTIELPLDTTMSLAMPPAARVSAPPLSIDASSLLPPSETFAAPSLRIR